MEPVRCLYRTVPRRKQYLGLVQDTGSLLNQHILTIPVRLNPPSCVQPWACIGMVRTGQEIFSPCILVVNNCFSPAKPYCLVPIPYHPSGKSKWGSVLKFKPPVEINFPGLQFVNCDKRKWSILFLAPLQVL